MWGGAGVWGGALLLVPVLLKTKLKVDEVDDTTVFTNDLTTSKNIFKSSLIILSTPYGLLTNKEAIAMNTGGKLIYILS